MLSSLFKKIVITLLTLFPFFVGAQNVEPQLFFGIEGRVQAYIADPINNKTGVEGFSVYQESSNAQLELVYNIQNVVYTNPIDGEYKISFAGQHDEQFIFTVGYVDASGKYKEQEFIRWNEKSSATIMTVSLMATAGTFELSSKQFLVSKAQTTLTSNKTNITWTPVASSTGYSVFYKYNDYPYYTILTTTTATGTTANIPYATDSGDESFPNDLHYFAVAANLQDGTQTVFSVPVSNADQDGDNIRDWVETNTHSTSPTNSDTDGDTLNDFLEINLYGTNPTKADTDGDNFNDNVELASSTNPLSSSSYPQSETVVVATTTATTTTEETIATTTTSGSSGGSGGGTSVTQQLQEEADAAEEEEHAGALSLLALHQEGVQLTAEEKKIVIIYLQTQLVTLLQELLILLQEQV